MNYGSTTLDATSNDYKKYHSQHIELQTQITQKFYDPKFEPSTYPAYKTTTPRIKSNPHYQ